MKPGVSRGQVYLSNHLSSILDYASKNSYQENVLLLPDKDIYFAGEEIRFSIFLLEGKYNLPEALSKVVAVELIDAVSQPLIRKRFSIDNSRGAGILQIPGSVPTGNYLLRAYSNWMKNDGPETYFHMVLTIINPNIAAPKLPDGKPDILKIEFHPEGGHLLSGVESRIVTRITDHLHRPYLKNMIIENMQGDSITSLEIDESGFGEFSLLPEFGSTYGIRYNDSLYSLPRSINDGLGLKIQKIDNAYFIQLTTGSVRQAEEELTLLIHQKGEASHIERIRTIDHKYSAHISFATLPLGISEVSVLDAQYAIHASRLLHMPDVDEVNFSLKGNRERYKQRDTVRLSFDTEVNSLVSVTAYLPAAQELVPENFSREEEISFGFNVETGCWNTTEGLCTDQVLIFAGGGRNGYKNLMAEKKMNFLPEIRGQIISGSLINKGRQQSDASHIFMANLGSDCDVQQLEVREDGSFFIAPGAYEKSSNFIFLNDSKEKLSIMIHPEFSNEYANVAIPEFDPKSLNVSRIEELMLDQQIYSIYRPLKREIAHQHAYKFYGKPDQSIQLQDYINLPVMEEFFRELLGTTIFTREEGALKLNVLNKYTNRIIGPNPLYLIDGIPIFDTRTILDLDPENMKSIHVKARKYVYGNTSWDGIIDMESQRGDGSVLELGEGTATYIYEPSIHISDAEIMKSNFSSTRQHTPDKRSVICWQPGITAGSDGSGEIEFTCSDVAGDFVIKITVLTPQGQVRTFYEQLTVQ